MSCFETVSQKQSCTNINTGASQKIEIDSENRVAHYKELFTCLLQR